MEWARRRCKCTDEKQWYPHYGAKGIKCTLTALELKEIWERDGAAAMKRPSLDRKESMYNYANWNVRFVEFNANSKRAWGEGSNFMKQYVEPVPEFT